MSEAQKDYWFVSEKGAQHGPYSEEMLLSRLAQRRFTKEALVWRNGWAIWQPISVHFAAQPLLSSVKPLDEKSTSKPGQPSLNSLLRWAALLGSIGGVGLFWSGWRGLGIVDATKFLWCWIAFAVGIGLTGTAAVYLFWQRARRSGQSQKFAGMRRVAIVSWAVVVGLTTIIIAAATPRYFRVHVARENFEHYSLNTDVLAHAITIKGLIGPGLAEKFATELNANSAIKIVKISSYGGLIDQALLIAHDIEKRADVSVSSEGRCNSACIIIFMSGKDRIASRDMHFGFHASSAITNLNGAFDQEALHSLEAEADVYLQGRGIPETFLANAKKLGAEKLFPVSAIKMADIGAVTQLVDGAKPISISRAKWLSILDALKHYPSAKDALSLFLTIGNLTPAIADEYGPKLWSANEAGDKMAVTSAARDLVGLLASKALPSADDGALAEFARMTSAELVLVRDARRWDVCELLLDGKGLSDFSLPQIMAKREFATTRELILSAAKNDWKLQQIPSWAESNGVQVSREVALAMLADGEDIRQMDGNSRITCDWSVNLMVALASKPDAKLAAIYRWLAKQK